MRFNTINYKTNEESTIVKQELESLAQKNQSLFSNQNRVSVSYELNNIIIGYYTSADLSLLSNFDEFKDELDVVNNSMITLGKDFKYGSYNHVIITSLK